MEKQFLFENEEILLRAADSSFTLTNLRLRQDQSKENKVSLTSVYLKNIDAIHVTHKDYPLLLVLGTIIAIAGFVGFLAVVGNNRILNTEALFFLALGLIPGGLLIWLYFSTINHFISITSIGGNSIQLQGKGMSAESVVSFVNKVEHAQHQLHQKRPLDVSSSIV